MRAEQDKAVEAIIKKTDVKNKLWEESPVKGTLALQTSCQFFEWASWAGTWIKMNYLNLPNPFDKVSHQKLLKKLSSHNRSEHFLAEEKMC